MTVPSFTSVFDRLDLGNVFPRIPSPFAGMNYQNAFAGVARALQAFQRPLLFDRDVRGTSRRGVEDAVRGTGVAVPVDRQLTEWEVERLADALFEKMRRQRHKARPAVHEVDYEVVEAANVPAQSEAEVPESVEKGRPLAELPSETLLKALKLLQKYGVRKYASTRLATIVEHWVQRAEKFELAEDFHEEKSATRRWVREYKPAYSQGKRKNRGQLLALSTLNQVINSLEPIYQELRESMRSKLAPKLEVTKAA